MLVWGFGFGEDESRGAGKGGSDFIVYTEQCDSPLEALTRKHGGGEREGLSGFAKARRRGSGQRGSLRRAAPSAAGGTHGCMRQREDMFPMWPGRKVNPTPNSRAGGRKVRQPIHPSTASMHPVAHTLDATRGAANKAMRAAGPRRCDACRGDVSDTHGMVAWPCWPSGNVRPGWSVFWPGPTTLTALCTRMHFPTRGHPRCTVRSGKTSHPP